MTGQRNASTLAHPLPAGLRDLLPEEARRRRALARTVLDELLLHGYELVVGPAFELAEVLERGLGELDPSDVLRFVEPESGEIAALRPDMTPQIARMVATRLVGAPPPIRLCYEGTIVRRRQGRARRDRQVPQAGVELYGVGAIAGDLEILRLAASVVRRAGVASLLLDVGHAGVARALLEPLPPQLARAVGDALAQKDPAGVAALVRGLPGARALEALTDLHGGGAEDPAAEKLLARAKRELSGSGAERALEDLAALWRAVIAAPELAWIARLDVGHVRGLAYYTGMIFHVLAPGAGEPVGSGGRYDDLLARFDAPMPAVGFALHLEALARAREAAGVADAPEPRVLVAGSGAEGLAAALRAQGIAAVAHASDVTPDRYAAAWRLPFIAEIDGAQVVLRGGDDALRCALGEVAAMAGWLRRR